MSFSSLDPFYYKALAILQNAKTPDGGTISHILSYLTQSNLLRQFNDSRNSSLLIQAVRNEGVTQIQSTLFHHGFFWAIFFGVLWMMVLFSSTIALCVLHFRRKQTSKTMMTYKMVAKVLQKRRVRMDSNRICMLSQSILSVSIILFLVIFFSLTTKSVVDIRRSLSESTHGSENAILPRAASALQHLETYLSEFARNAANQSAPIVEEIVAETERQQNESSFLFNQALQAKLGGARSMELGDKMTHFLLTLTDNCQELTTVNTQLFSQWQTLNNQVNLWKRSLRHLAIPSNTTDSRSQMIKKLLNWNVAPNSLSLRVDFASSFVYFMQKENRTRERIVEDSQFAKKKMKEKMEAMRVRMNVELNVPQLLRNTIGETWKKMDVKFQELVRKFSHMRTTLNMLPHQNLKKLSIILVLIVLLCLLIFGSALLTGSYIFYRYHWSKPSLSNQRRNTLKVCSYAHLMALTFPLSLSMILFLTTGYLEDDLCRYIRTTNLEVELSRNQIPLLDRNLNDFLHYNWPIIEKLAENPKEPEPIPRPRKFLSAIVGGCRDNAPLLDALDAIKTMDTSALSKPELTNRIIAVGRRLMLQAMNETHPTEMLAPGTLENLEKADSLDKFLQTNLTSLLVSIDNYHVISEGTEGLSFFDIIETLSIFTKMLENDNSSTVVDVLKCTNNMSHILQRMTATLQITKEQVNEIKQLPLVMPIVQELLILVKSTIAKLENKKELLQMADELFTELVVKPTPKNSAQLMAKFGPKLMGSIGHCRPLYLAYRDVTFAVCTSILSPLSGLWLFLGSMCLLCTTFLIFLLSVLSKRDLGLSKRGGDDPSLHLNNKVNDESLAATATLLAPKHDKEYSPGSRAYPMTPLYKDGEKKDECIC